MRPAIGSRFTWHNDNESPVYTVYGHSTFQQQAFLVSFNDPDSGRLRFCNLEVNDITFGRLVPVTTEADNDEPELEIQW